MMNSPFCLAGFGEVMLRLCTPGYTRLAQCLPGSLEATFGGSEANVCAAVAHWGGRSRCLTALPTNPVSQAFAVQLRGMGCQVEQIHYTPEGRMGVYYVEQGTNMRGGSVIYDREGSVISQLSPQDYDFNKMLEGVTHLFLSGITPALSKNAFDSTLALARIAHEKHISIALDLNFRSKLWNWDNTLSKKELAKRCLAPITELADIIIANEGCAYDVFGLKATNANGDFSRMNLDNSKDVAKQLAKLFPNARIIAFTMRESFSANHNNWGGLLYDCNTNQFHVAPMDNSGNPTLYEMRDIVDRIGGGDAFSAGLLFALNTDGLNSPDKAIRYAVAAGALAHTIVGDYCLCSRTEVENLMNGSLSGRVQR